MRQTGHPQAVKLPLRRARLAGHHAGLRMVMQEQSNDASTRGLEASMSTQQHVVTPPWAVKLSGELAHSGFGW